jgi:hypothetical protein
MEYNMMLASIYNDGSQDKACMPIMKRIDNPYHYTFEDNIYNDNKTILECTKRSNILDDTLYTKKMMTFPITIKKEFIIDIHQFKDENQIHIFPNIHNNNTGRCPQDYDYWINEFGIVLENLDDLDKFTITIDIGGSIIIKMDNLLVNNLISNRIKYNNNLFYVPISYFLLNYEYPFPDIGLFYHGLSIYVKYRGSELLDSNFNFYINYSKVKNKYGSNYCDKPVECAKSLQEFDYWNKYQYCIEKSDVQQPIPENRLEKIIHQEQNVKQLLVNSQHKTLLPFNHPVHLLYMYFDDYGDYLEDCKLIFDGRVLKDIKFTKVNSDIYDKLNNYINSVNQAYSKVLQRLPISGDVCKYIALPKLLYKTNSCEILKNKTIYKIEFTSQIDHYSFVMPKLYFNFSRIERAYLSFTHNFKDFSKNINLNVGCLNKNLLRSLTGMSGLAFSN